MKRRLLIVAYAVLACVCAYAIGALLTGETMPRGGVIFFLACLGFLAAQNAASVEKRP